jgi:predicted peroxiredoxin
MARILYVVTAGTDDPTRAALPFNFALGALEAGHQPEIFLTGEGVYLLKEDVAGGIVPVGPPPLREMLGKLVEQRVPVYACGRCCVARGIEEADLKALNAQFISPKIFAEKVVAADRVVTT